MNAATHSAGSETGSFCRASKARVLLVATTDQDVRLARVAFCWSGVKGDQKPDQPSQMIVTLDHLTNYLLPMIFKVRT